MLQCHNCGAEVTLAEPIPRDAECESCRTDLRSCANCRHYDPRYNNACTETQADPVPDKQRRNFCEYFYFARAPFEAKAPSSREADARAKLEAMFGGSPSASSSAEQKLRGLFEGETQSKEARADEARRKLEGLFGEGKKPQD